jgi:acetyl-CoA/propionyl-CoA carboxylase biotin carboxyl carrier protein
VFDTVLVANRGEIACRVFRTLRQLGIRAVGVYSDADRDARHVLEADVAVRIGPAPARASYLAIDRLVQACLDTGAQAVHPGYGFLAESADFAFALEAAGIVFVGPPVGALRTMGDKIRAKHAMVDAGVPVVPGRGEPGMTDDDLVEAAEKIGLPVLVKPSAGGGGKGMHAVYAPDGLAAAIARARREAASSFGDDTLFVERLVTRPRHLEIQVLADTQGGVIHLGERECSLQRRHQKVIEEAPSARLDPQVRARMGAAAVAAARAVSYTGAGTVEFIAAAADPADFFFMEMNTRLQVEHPVTELVTGIDLVEQQLRVAAGEPLGLAQDDVVTRGHAVEARVYAEDPGRGFLPTGGRALLVRHPGGDGVRVDSALVEGAVVGTSYDPMLAKVVAWGHDRAEALRRLDRALAGTAVLGLGTNIAFQRALLAHPDVAAGRLDTDLVERELAGLVGADLPGAGAQAAPDAVFAAFALARLGEAATGEAGTRPWGLPCGWRPTGPAWSTWELSVNGRRHTLSARPRPSGPAGGQPSEDGQPSELDIRVGEAEARTASAHLTGPGRGHGPRLDVTVGATTSTFLVAQAGGEFWLGQDGATWVISEQPRRTGARPDDLHQGEVLSPMPGSVVAVHAALGDTVAAGQPLVVVEAMKMEYTLRAPRDGVVVELRATVGEQVALDAPLALVAPPSAPAEEAS